MIACLMLLPVSISLQDREEIYSLVLKIQYNFTFIQTFDFIFLLPFSKVTGIGTCIKVKCFYIMPQLRKIIFINFLDLLMFKGSNCIKHLIFPHHFGFLIILDIFFLAGLYTFGLTPPVWIISLHYHP